MLQVIRPCKGESLVKPSLVKPSLVLRVGSTHRWTEELLWSWSPSRYVLWLEAMK